MRYVFFSFLLLVSFVPASAHAGFYGPIISEECKCASVSVEGTSETVSSAPAYGCVLQALQYVIRIVITIGFVLMTLALVYAGFIWMTSAGNPGKVEQGKHLLVNTLLGIFIILGAWLLIDFVMKTIYSEGSFGPWNNILAADGDSASRCLVAKQPHSLTEGALTLITGSGPSGGPGGIGAPTTPPLAGADGTFTYQSGVASQVGSESPTLRYVLSCMAQRVPANVGQISSISDSRIVSGAKTFAQCAAEGNPDDGGTCAHTQHSCHYGGMTCVGQSYAADFGDDQNRAAIIAAARACGARTLDEGTHVHVSVGAASGCGCEL